MSEKDDQLKMIRAERDFLHDMSNQLVISHGMSSYVLNALNKMDNPDEKWIAKLEKSTKAMDRMINMVKDRRSLLIKITEDLNNDEPTESEPEEL